MAVTFAYVALLHLLPRYLPQFIRLIVVFLLPLQMHNVSDIIGGFVLAIIFVTPFVIKAIVSLPGGDRLQAQLGRHQQWRSLRN